MGRIYHSNKKQNIKLLRIFREGVRKQSYLERKSPLGVRGIHTVDPPNQFGLSTYIIMVKYAITSSDL